MIQVYKKSILRELLREHIRIGRAQALDSVTAHVRFRRLVLKSSDNGVHMENQEKKRILHVVEAFGGGVFSYLVGLTKKLAEKYEIYILFGMRDQTPADYESYFDRRVHLIQVKNFTRKIDPKSDIRAFGELRKLAKEIDPDIIHLHSSKAGAIGRFAFQGRKVPVFYTPHGYSFLMENQSWKKCLMYKLIEGICAMRKSTTISCSVGEHRETLKLTKRAEYVNNGVDVQELQRIISAVPAAPENAPATVCTLGRITYQKNPALFCKIAAALPQVQFVWIGDGELRSELTAENITVTGWVKREEAIALCMKSRIFLLPSLWEGLPISLLEAMYMKKLAVVSDVIGNRDVVHNQVNGFVCKTLDEYVAAIRRGVQMDADCRAYIEHAYREILSEYSLDVMCGKYDEIYQRALNACQKD